MVNLIKEPKSKIYLLHLAIDYSQYDEWSVGCYQFDVFKKICATSSLIVFVHKKYHYFGHEYLALVNISSDDIHHYFNFIELCEAENLFILLPNSAISSLIDNGAVIDNTIEFKSAEFLQKIIQLLSEHFSNCDASVLVFINGFNKMAFIPLCDIEAHRSAIRSKETPRMIRWISQIFFILFSIFVILFIIFCALVMMLYLFDFIKSFFY